MWWSGSGPIPEAKGGRKARRTCIRVVTNIRCRWGAIVMNTASPKWYHTNPAAFVSFQSTSLRSEQVTTHSLPGQGGRIFWVLCLPSVILSWRCMYVTKLFLNSTMCALGGDGTLLYDKSGCYAVVCLCSYCSYCCSCYRRLSDEVMKDFSPYSPRHIAWLCVYCIPSIWS